MRKYPQDSTFQVSVRETTTTDDFSIPSLTNSFIEKDISQAEEMVQWIPYLLCK